MKKAQPMELDLETRPESVELSEQLAADIARTVGFDDEQVFEIQLAVRECVINALDHGNFWDPQKSVTLTFTVTPDSFIAQIRDQGQGFNPKALPDPHSAEGLNKTSGRGILLARFYMDDVNVAVPAGGGAIVTLTKKRTCSRVEVGKR